MRFLAMWLALAVLVLLAGCSKSNLPSEAELRQDYEAKMPAYVEIRTFTVDAQQNLGNEVEPNILSRVTIKVATKTELFVPFATEDGVTIIEKRAASGDLIDVFGKITSRLYQGKWRHVYNIEGNPYGDKKPQSAFQGETVIAGTPEEQAFRERQRVAAEERQTLEAENEKRLAEERNRVETERLALAQAAQAARTKVIDLKPNEELRKAVPAEGLGWDIIAGCLEVEATSARGIKTAARVCAGDGKEIYQPLRKPAAMFVFKAGEEPATLRIIE